MIRATYEHVCDICKGVIRVETFEVAIFVPAQNMEWPKPRLSTCVGDIHVCEPCLTIAKAPLIERFRELNPVEGA